MACLRRLWFEAHTIAISEIRQRVEARTDDTPRKLPVAERSFRLNALRGQLAGVRIQGPLEPAHSLLDFVHQMREDDTLRYVDPRRCISRETELAGVKKDDFLKIDPNTGMIKTVKGEDSNRADLSTEHRARLALQRRSLALDQVNLVPYQVSEDWHDVLYNLLLKQVPDTHQPVSMAQLWQADRALWAWMAELTREGIQANAAGVLPVIVAMAIARTDPIVMTILQPITKGRSAPSVVKPNGENAAEDADQRDGRAKGKEVKGKGKGKPKYEGPLPQALHGMHAKTQKGEPICLNYSLAGCTAAKPGQKCSKGYHVCAKCRQHHLLNDCAKASAGA